MLKRWNDETIGLNNSTWLSAPCQCSRIVQFRICNSGSEKKEKNYAPHTITRRPTRTMGQLWTQVYKKSFKLTLWGFVSLDKSFNLNIESLSLSLCKSIRCSWFSKDCGELPRSSQVPIPLIPKPPILTVTWTIKNLSLTSNFTSLTPSKTIV